jgi:transposase-like protein
LFFQTNNIIFLKEDDYEFKEEIVALLRNGSSKKFVADRYGTSQVNLYNWIKKNNLDVKQQSV